MASIEKQVEFNEITGSPNEVIETLNRKIGRYKSSNRKIKIGITGRDPQTRFNEHLRCFDWSRMVVICLTNSIKFANNIENWLIDNHWEDLDNQRAGGGSNHLSPEGPNYAYVLLKK